MPSYLIDNPIPTNIFNFQNKSSLSDEAANLSESDMLIDEEETLLQDIIFGTSDFLKDSATENQKIPDSGFYIDNGQEEIKPEKKSAWTDPDDLCVNLMKKKVTKKLRESENEIEISGSSYEERLRNQFEKIYPKPTWVTKETDSEDNDNLLHSSGSILDSSSKLLTPERLQVVRMKDGNQMGYSKSVIQSLQFHPTAPVLLTAGLDKTIRLFQVDGKINSKITSVHYKDLPIYDSRFTADGTEIIVTGRRKYFYSLNIETGVSDRIFGIRGREDESFEKFYVSPCNSYLVFPGRSGHMSLLSRDTKQWMGDLKINSNVKSIDFSKDGEFMYSFGDDGQVHTWDMKMRRCISQFTDQGFIGGGSMAVSKNNEYLATGSTSGIVNLYTMDSCRNSNQPNPVKIMDNIVTPISDLAFNADSQILAVASKFKKDSLKLLHVPSRKVFANWPTSNTPLGYVSTIKFSPSGGYLAIGNDKGKVLLYRINAYARY